MRLERDGVNLSASVLIRRPPAAVWDYVIDVRHDVAWRPGIVEAAYTSEGAVGIGSEGFDLVEANGRKMMVRWVMSEFEPGSLARWELADGPIVGTGAYICEPVGSDTRFTLDAQVRPTGWYRLPWPILGAIGRRQNRAAVEKLKEIMEAAAA